VTAGEAAVERRFRCTTGSRSFRDFSRFNPLENRGAAFGLFCPIPFPVEVGILGVFSGGPGGVSVLLWKSAIDSTTGWGWRDLGARSGIFGIGWRRGRHRLLLFYIGNYHGLLLTWP